MILQPLTPAPSNLHHHEQIHDQRELERAEGKAEAENADLTDDDLTYAEGKEDELLGCLQKHLGRSRDEIQRKIETL